MDSRNRAYITHSLRETLLLVGTDHYTRAQSNFRAGDCVVERRTQLGEEVDVCAVVTVPVQKHRSHEGRMRPGVVADDGSALVDDHSDEARAEVKGPVDPEDRTRRTAITCAAEPLHVSQLLLRIQHDGR